MLYSPTTHGNRSTTHTQYGIGLVEAIVVISIASVSFAAIMAAAVFFLRTGLTTGDRAQATFLLEEGVESVRFLRDQGYTANITPLIDAGARYIVPSASGVTATTTNALIFNTFTRTIQLEEVYRRTSDDDIVASTSAAPKAVDANTAQLTVSVTWPSGSMQTVTYLTNLYEN